MPETYRQVLKTYTTRWMFWFKWAWCVLVIAIFPLWKMGEVDEHPAYFLLGIVFLFSCMFFSSTFAAQLWKRQFASTQVRLTPGYLKPHLVVAGVYSLCVVVFIPLLLAWRSGFHPAGFFAIGVSAYSFGAWVSTGISRVPMWLYFGLIAGGFVGYDLYWQIGLMLNDGQYAAVHIAWGCAVLLTLGWLLYRLTSLDEQSVGYGNQKSNEIWGTTIEAKRVRREMYAANERRLLVRLFNIPVKIGADWKYATCGWYRRSRLWRAGLAGENHWVLPLVLLVATGAYLAVTRGLESKVLAGFSSILWIYPATFCVSIVLVYPMALIIRFEKMGFELLRPMTRQQMMRDMIVCTLCESFKRWVFLTAVIGTVTAVRWPRFFAIEYMIPYVLMSWGIFMAAMGVGIWVAAIRIYLLNVVLPIFACMALPLIGYWFDFDRYENFWAPVLFGVLLIVTGVVGFWGAYRSWCRLELGRV